MPHCFMPVTGSALYLKRSKKDDVEVIEIGSEESDYTECLASEMPHSSAHSMALNLHVASSVHSYSYRYCRVVKIAE